MKTVTTNCIKKTKWLGLVASVLVPLFTGCAQPAPPPVPKTPLPEQPASSVPATVSPGVAEVLRLAQSGVAEDVILAYINNSTTGFNLSADQILYARDMGLSSQVITAMLDRDTALRNQPQPASASTSPPPAAPEP